MYELVSPINAYAVVKYIGSLLMIFALVLTVPVGAALLLGDSSSACYYALTAIITGMLGFAIYKALPDYELETKDAIVLAALAFPLISFVSSIPMSLTTGMPFIDAFFESVSATTTTGLSVAPTDAGPVFLFSRAWSQWVGGIGIILIALSIFVNPGASAFRIYKAYSGEKTIKPTVVSTTRLLGKIYVVITVIAIAILLLSGMSLFDATAHGLSSVSTGGFSTRPGSVGEFGHILVPLTIAIACIMGAINFELYPEALKNPKKIAENLELRSFFIIAGIGTLIFAFSILQDPGIQLGTTEIAFQVISALTTAGFSTLDMSVLPDSSKAVLSGLMWIGGSIGSTAGGIKIFRLIVLAGLIRFVFLRFFLPKETVTPFRIRDRVIENDELYQITVFVALYVVIVIVSTYILMLHGIGTENAIFEVSSALGTVGLSAGVTDATMPSVLKLVLCFDMLLGRIEIIPILILFMPRTWIQRAR
ncbi:TrkH family potassium uptake protein [Methanohalophilus halophilus]|uniref:Potassium transporter n=1 Tax=Methanohalophilus halophilus TaxID=2177 RepID=A0A1L3Q2I1_9EURY|nr:TrkH family potassium uptake protein [Methanohalophilus halophilus]APH39055.1 potassium transporter [Methanohalophilus halophilus]RNI09888.1 TrkH family potassium uptake protein [Methanohalophilus halophilus]SDW91912.1 trk system potassium uptake protein TrkH [Methanohalophilus halophilus]